MLVVWWARLLLWGFSGSLECILWVGLLVWCAVSLNAAFVLGSLDCLHVAVYLCFVRPCWFHGLFFVDF